MAPSAEHSRRPGLYDRIALAESTDRLEVDAGLEVLEEALALTGVCAGRDEASAMSAPRRSEDKLQTHESRSASTKLRTWR